MNDMTTSSISRGDLPPPPRTLEDTGLGLLFLCELLCKVLFLRGRLGLRALSSHVKLPASIVEQVLDFMRNEHLCEVLSRDSSAGIVYQLSGTGRERAADALTRSQYAGPAPVPLDVYAAYVKRQSIHKVQYTREHLAEGFRGLVINESLLARLGAGMNSGRAIIIHGPAGAGKTYIAEQLSRLLCDQVAVPYAFIIDNEVIQVFDPHVHRPMPTETPRADALARSTACDERWQSCLRPMVIAGSELTLKTLDLEFDHTTRVYQAPPHVKANNGVFVVDDLGRQMMAPQDLMNRWIVPLDRRRDYLTLHTGYKFEIPFDVVVVFSSNLDPAGLADEAFLRRLGYKIHIGALTRDQYREVFLQACADMDIPFSEQAFNYLLQERHEKENRPLLACYPRDLLGQIRDLARYEEAPPALTTEALDWAWHNYFLPAPAATDRNTMPAHHTQSTSYGVTR
ncbi:ATP-binding protein [Noviherbaspirillum denitrificans]|uniref:ATP-binding protein n=1 Tax=Noviherbaspirillum denitrificans TaxID=1968433 RepID=UPI00197F1177|nr:ATP-binding protein [Noviherbaspirillum denitrificans]